MCGRYLMENSLEQLSLIYGLGNIDIEFDPYPEIFPSTFAPVLIGKETRQLKLFKWGFDFDSGKGQVINARCETVFEKPMFRSSFQSRRCIIPANAFYEWKPEGNRKVKYKISLKETPVFSMAGVYNIFRDRNNNPFTAFVVITTSANEAVSAIHNRMPVILPAGSEDVWLNPDNSKSTSAIDLMKPYDSDALILKAAV